MAKIHFCSTYIAWLAYWNGLKLFSKFEVWQKLSLIREKNNRFDAHAVAIFYKNQKIGYIPREDNYAISKIFDAGYDKIFSARINRISANEHPENQIWITIKISTKK